MGRVFDNEFYLLGVQFHAMENVDGNKEFVLWNVQNDLTQEKKLAGKVRPIPGLPHDHYLISKACHQYVFK